MVGAGASAKFKVDFVGGKFRIETSAGFCWGLGLKGGLTFVVGAGEILSFLHWLYYALYTADFSLLDIVTKKAFEAWKNYHFLVVATAPLTVPIAVNVAATAHAIDTIGKMLVEAEDKVKAKLAEFKADMEKGRLRKQLANSITSFDKDVRRCPPEVRGMLIYQLMQHGGILDDLGTRDITMNEERMAILYILKQCQSVSDFDNTIQHIHETGKRGNDRENGKNLEKFMESWEFKGALRRTTLQKSPNSTLLQVLRANLYKTPALGYPALDNDTLEYDLQRDCVHPRWDSRYYERIA
jgi:hypothetical protein